MKKVLSFSLMILVLFSLVGCGSNSYNESMDASAPTITMSEGMDYDSGFRGEEEFETDKNNATDDGFLESEESQGSSFEYGNRKVIKRGNLTIETLIFDVALNSIEEEIKVFDGYIEGLDVYSGNLNRQALQRGAITVRVPKENYDAFLESIGNVGHVVSQNSSIEDVSEYYFDTEARLDSLKIQEERLLEFLKKATKLEETIQLERELSNIRYQIESLTGSLRKLDGLISFSTVTISLVEVYEPTIIEPTPKEGFGSQLMFGFEESFRNLKDGAEGFLVALASGIFQIVLMLGFLFIVFVMLKKRLEKDKQNFINSKKENENDKKIEK